MKRGIRVISKAADHGREIKVELKQEYMTTLITVKNIFLSRNPLMKKYNVAGNAVTRYIERS